ncbi:CHAD domain-containing protein [Luteolibacter luteus]|uniref:CHAD domain-containing protein n=1 Tax=Luteolibacter luteus TaxID=2728835 RepID=A0A858RFW9_9BACT|nr:CHAD domain-containing protein [Luteolibacter luteus]QJE95605.1 CHAD domain-containing protein [Luteolibacter luteus]
MSEAPSDFISARPNLIAASIEMERMLSGLTDSHGRVADEIHVVRKHGKRLRGGLAVIGEAKPCIRWIAVIGRMLGGSRDAVVRAKTWDSLNIDSSIPGSVEAAIYSILGLEAHAAARRPPQEVIDWSLAALVQVRNRLEARSDEETAELAEKGSGHLKKQLKKRLKRALQRVHNEDFHDCRKAAKAWLGGMSIVAPDLEIPAKSETEKLADNLGDENDLEVLAKWLTDRGFTHATTRVAWKSLLKRQEKIRRRSISLIRKELLPVIDPKN